MDSNSGADAAVEPVLLLLDGVGGWYAVPRSLAEQCRASDALLAAVEQAMAEHSTADEVTGYGFSPRALVSCSVGGAVLLVAAGLGLGGHGPTHATGDAQVSTVGYQLGSAAPTGGGQNGMTATGGRGDSPFSATGGGRTGFAATGGGANALSATGDAAGGVPPAT